MQAADTNLQIKAINEINRLIDLANELYPSVNLQYPTVTFGLRSGKAGTASCRYNRNEEDNTIYVYYTEVKINPYLLAQHEEIMLTNTIPHEIAHLVIFMLYPGESRSHDAEWAAVARSLGLDNPTPFHLLDISNTPSEANRHLYSCSCQTHWLSTARHNLWNRNNKALICNGCNGHLTYIKSNNKKTTYDENAKLSAITKKPINKPRAGTKAYDCLDLIKRHHRQNDFDTLVALVEEEFKFDRGLAKNYVTMALERIEVGF